MVPREFNSRPVVGESFFNPSAAEAAPPPFSAFSKMGEAGWGQEAAMTEDSTTFTPERLGGL